MKTTLSIHQLYAKPNADADQPVSRSTLPAHHRHCRRGAAAGGPYDDYRHQAAGKRGEEGAGRADAATACRGGDRRLRGRSAPAAGGVSGADAEDLPVNCQVLACQAPVSLYLCPHIVTLNIG